MKSTIRLIAISITVVALIGSLATAQDLAEQLSKMGKDAAEGYVTPLFAGWAADLNSAFYHSADLHDILGFDVGVKVFLDEILPKIRSGEES